MTTNLRNRSARTRHNKAIAWLSKPRRAGAAPLTSPRFHRTRVVTARSIQQRRKTGPYFGFSNGGMYTTAPFDKAHARRRNQIAKASRRANRPR